LGKQKAIRGRERLVTDDPGLASLSFLYSAYEPRCYWFEVVETLRRLLMIGGMLFFNPGSGGQIMVSLVVCMGVHAGPPTII